MMRRKRSPTTPEREPIPEKVYAIIQRRGREVVQAIGHLPETTLAEIAMCGYLRGLEDMALARDRFPKPPTNPPDDWQLP